MQIGTIQQLATEDILRMFRPVEGETCFYYGRIRNGKTYAATADIIRLLERGEIVYANWKLDLEDYDERDRFIVSFVKTLFGKKLFFRYKIKENFHYFSPDLGTEETIKLLSNLVGVHIFIDEGQWMFNSHIKNHDDETRKLILHNGHYCRSLNIISQRPSNVMKDMRSQINVWYKCEKRLSWPLLIFQKTAIEDMKDDIPDEESEHVRVRVYFANKKVLRAYNTHAMRGPDAVEDMAKFEVYYLSFWERVGNILAFMVPRRWRQRRQQLKLRRAAALAPLKPDSIHLVFEEVYGEVPQKPLYLRGIRVIS